ncbi:hypothetical protein AMTR_s00037p00229470 [Amborella trichopoda]|uniref:Uncharacterized protein n=1 Tax=Amborella trichopoda TaxID=13333 RepID=U5D7N0_AMBTC|nr:hypothetical protein AMTR_s00037p00229470 [Amborella trichopoda]
MPSSRVLSRDQYHKWRGYSDGLRLGISRVNRKRDDRKAVPSKQDPLNVTSRGMYGVHHKGRESCRGYLCRMQEGRSFAFVIPGHVDMQSARYVKNLMPLSHMNIANFNGSLCNFNGSLCNNQVWPTIEPQQSA